MHDAFDRLQRFAAVGALVAVLAFFAVAAPGFATLANVERVLVNNFALLAIAALGMTLALSIGAIDLSLGTAIDVASLAFVAALAHRAGFAPAALAGLGAALAVGAGNALLVTRLGIAPFLATLGTLFIGQTIQQLATGGGQPIYLLSAAPPPAFDALAHGAWFGVALPLWIVAALAIALHLALEHSTLGRQARALGAQPGVARYSGLRVGALAAGAFVASALIYGTAGLVLSSTVKSYAPQAGNAYLLNAIGATFIGATLSATRRPNVVGTLVGVLLVSFVANGLLLIGWNFYWQQVASGALVFAVLVLGSAFGRGRLAREAGHA
ncbi:MULTISPECIES: ABC transporter permease [Burkholderia]|uniref:ABC transporter permease n=1 Tax=Burkholderia TaxID=32008 RepID=UPI0005314C8D|nr:MULTISPECIES: ABC transporter permease [Burkholderia]AOJ83670.1 branched-chain amino acid ABC transporter permease [Burkholderia savannae]KGS03444.1 branched-chain amino acid transport system / permease component family protein [Burkholderia sp. ABCPW 111]KVK87960.1 branched-chain amino acid ABC transporter permease [Burkholderia sp. MSMB1498]